MIPGRVEQIRSVLFGILYIRAEVGLKNAIFPVEIPNQTYGKKRCNQKLTPSGVKIV